MTHVTRLSFLFRLHNSIQPALHNSFSSQSCRQLPESLKTPHGHSLHGDVISHQAPVSSGAAETIQRARAAAQWRVGAKTGGIHAQFGCSETPALQESGSDRRKEITGIWSGCFQRERSNVTIATLQQHPSSCSERRSARQPTEGRDSGLEGGRHKGSVTFSNS